MKKIIENKGITLVALVITIIILLILAGVAIAQLQDNGLFGKTNIAKTKHENAQIEEDDMLKQYENAIADTSRGTITISEEELNKKIFGEVLWTNPNPTVNFEAQTVSISNITTYKMLKVICRFALDTAAIVTFEMPITDVGTIYWIETPWCADGQNGAYLQQRKCSIVATGIQFEAARYSGTTANHNQRIIPLKVLGFK